MKIIDARVRLRTEQILKAWTTELKPYYQDYIKFYKMKSRLSVLSVEMLIDQAAKAGISKMLICGNDENDNDHLIETARHHPNLIPIATVSVEKGIRFALREVQRCRENGAAAIYMAPYRIRLDSNDHLLYPIYGYCELMNIPMILHGSIHFWQGAYMWHGQPRFVDEVAVDFPELRLIISHAGNGFGPTMLSVAQRHPNVYLEFSALDPTSLAPDFLYAANTYLSSKCIFGTDYPMMEFDQQIEKWKGILREDVQQSFFYSNLIEALDLKIAD